MLETASSSEGTIQGKIEQKEFPAELVVVKAASMAEVGDLLKLEPDIVLCSEVNPVLETDDSFSGKTYTVYNNLKVSVFFRHVEEAAKFEPGLTAAGFVLNNQFHGIAGFEKERAGKIKELTQILRQRIPNLEVQDPDLFSVSKRKNIF